MPLKVQKPFPTLEKLLEPFTSQKNKKNKEFFQRRLNLELLPMPVINETLKLSNKVRHCRSHLYFFFGVEQPPEMERSHFERAVSSQDCFGYTREKEETKIEMVVALVTFKTVFPD